MKFQAPDNKSQIPMIQTLALHHMLRRVGLFYDPKTGKKVQALKSPSLSPNRYKYAISPK
jgi:hypothetical protein